MKRYCLIYCVRVTKFTISNKILMLVFSIKTLLLYQLDNDSTQRLK
jgi:hypothetical protein